MTRKMLESYKANERLIEENNRKIEDEQCKVIPSIYGKVKGSSNDFPYIERRYSVQMEDPNQADRRYSKIRKWKYENKKAQKDMDLVERFIDNIENVQHKEIFIYRYINGMKVKDVAKKISYTHGRVSQIISKYLKD